MDTDIKIKIKTYPARVSKIVLTLTRLNHLLKGSKAFEPFSPFFSAENSPDGGAVYLTILGCPGKDVISSIDFKTVKYVLNPFKTKFNLDWIRSCQWIAKQLKKTIVSEFDFPDVFECSNSSPKWSRYNTDWHSSNLGLMSYETSPSVADVYWLYDLLMSRNMYRLWWDDSKIYQV